MPYRSKRSVDKQIISILIAPAAATTRSEFLFPNAAGAAPPVAPATGVGFPCTISGVRVVGSVSNATLAAQVPHQWAVMINRQGQSLPNMSLAATPATAILPEEDCMLYGRGSTFYDSTANQGGIFLKHYDSVGSTKRKLMVGDALAMLFSCTGAIATFNLAVQFFVSI